MTKKDYELIARNIKGSLQRELEIEREGNNTWSAQASLKVLAIGLADELLIDNPKFNPQKFLIACGLAD